MFRNTVLDSLCKDDQRLAKSMAAKRAYANAMRSESNSFWCSRSPKKQRRSRSRSREVQEKYVFKTHVAVQTEEQPTSDALDKVEQLLLQPTSDGRTSLALMTECLRASLLRNEMLTKCHNEHSECLKKQLQEQKDELTVCKGRLRQHSTQMRKLEAARHKLQTAIAELTDSANRTGTNVDGVVDLTIENDSAASNKRVKHRGEKR